MAFYNPKQLNFQPNAQVIQQAGALGKQLQDNAVNKFNQDLQTRQAQLLMDKFNYTQKQDAIKNQQWQDTMSWNKQRADVSDGYKNADLVQNADKYAYQVETDKEKNKIEKSELAIKQAEEKRRADNEKMKSLLYLQNNPQLATQVGALSQEQKFGTPTEQIMQNPILASLLKTPENMSPAPQVDVGTEGMSVPNIETQNTWNMDKVSGFGDVYDKTVKDAISTTLSTDQKNYQAYSQSMIEAGLKPEPFHEYYQKVLNKKNLGRGINDATIMQEEEAKIARNMGIQPYQLANIDMSKLSDEQRYILQNYAVKADNAYRETISGTAREKMMPAYARMSKSVEDLSRAVQTNDSGLMNRAFNVVNNYLGFGDVDELARKSFTQSNYADFRNTMLKIVSGANVPMSEATRFNQAMGTLYQTDTVAMKKFQTQIGLARNELQTIKDGFSPVVFNIRYGSILRSLDNAYNTLGGKIGDGSGTNQPGGSDTTYKSIIKKRTNKTINVNDAQNYGITFE